MSKFERPERPERPEYKVTITQVPPPKSAPHYAESEAAGIHPGFRLSEEREQWRCCSCGKMQQSGSRGAWIPDGMRRSDPYWAFTEAARASAYNMHGSLWCLRCVPRIQRESLKPERAPRLMSPQDPRMNLVAAALFIGIVACTALALYISG